MNLAAILDRVERLEEARRRPARTAPLFRLAPATGPRYLTTDPDGTLVAHVHEGQRAAIEAPERFVLILAGTRGGKSVSGPFWLLRQMLARGPGEYLAVAPTYGLLAKGVIKALRRVFCAELRLGRVVGQGSGELRISEAGHYKLWPDREYAGETKVVFGHAANPDSLEAAEYKAAWLDEAGQRGFKQESWEAIQRRLAIDEGPALMTTTPYVLQHWIKDIYDRAKGRERGEGGPGDEDYRVVSFESRMNPAFPAAEWDRAKAVLPPWKFDLFYRGILTRPAGAVYDCFRDEGPDTHVKPGGDVFNVPSDWPIRCGVDFGSPNFAAVFACEVMEEQAGPARSDGRAPRKTPSGTHWIFAEYRPEESRTVAQHVAAMKGITGGRLPDLCAGGSASEQWLRDEFGAAGWPISPPNQTEVEVGIGRVYEGFATRRLFVFDSCPKLIDEIRSYSRQLDETGNVLNELEDKSSWHLCDAGRYLCNYLFEPAPTFTVISL
ncbi:MAG TPA: terminase family protein [Gemmataceae bacterium]|nr:terminase family protein [Gemmataceae bacterium]